MEMQSWEPERFACLAPRWGEAIALQRDDLDLDARTVSVTKAYSEVNGSILVVGPTKSRAGVRTVSVPAHVVPYLNDHFAMFTPTTDGALVFTGVTADTTNCPETATKLPGGGHENCPRTVMRSARHDSVCLAASRG
jgi:integrase